MLKVGQQALLIVIMIKDVCLCVCLCIVENSGIKISFKSLEEMCYNIQLLMYHLLSIIFKNHFNLKKSTSHDKIYGNSSSVAYSVQPL